MIEQPSGFYQLLPPLSEDEHAALMADIQANGVLVPVIVDQHETVIDGHNRQQIADQLGIPCPKVVREFSSDDERYEFALGLNLKRRHMSREQMRQLIAGECARTPEASDRQIARRLGVSHHTVASVRRPQVGNLPTEEEEPQMTREEALAGLERLRRATFRFDAMTVANLMDGMPPAMLAKAMVQWHQKFSAKYGYEPEVTDSIWRYDYGPRVQAVLSWDGENLYEYWDLIKDAMEEAA